jgi:hypothetical protein
MASILGFSSFANKELDSLASQEKQEVKRLAKKKLGKELNSTSLQQKQQLEEMLDLGWDLGVSPAEWLFGQHLREIYERHIGEVPVTRDGPYVKFVIATLDALGLTTSKGKPYSADTIIKALTNARTGKFRR